MGTEVTIINAGQNGHNTADLLARVEADVFRWQPDLVVLMVGTNDMLNTPGNMIPLAEYVRNYQQLIDLIKPKAALVLMTIAPVNPASILRRVDISVYDNISPEVKVDQANAAIEKLAADNGLQLIDVYRILQATGGPTDEFESIFMNVANQGIEDGVHPTTYGYKILGMAVYQALQYLQPNAKNIVCFGDSITRGYKVDGEGTTEGDTYPAVLNRLSNFKHL